MPVINKLHGFPAGFGKDDPVHLFRWMEADLRGNTKFRPEVVLDVLIEILFNIHHTCMDQYFIGADVIGKDFNHIIFNPVDVVKDVVECRWVEGCALEFDHLVFSADDRSQPDGPSATGTRFAVKSAHIAGLKT